MSWLKKIISKFGAQDAEQTAEEVLNAMPTAQCLTAEVASASAAVQEDENPTKQRRYFVKRGLFVDYEDENSTAVSAAAEEIPDKRPVDLKTLFPKLSLR